MPIPLARTPKEAHLYIEMHPCECGESRFAINQSSLISAGEGFARKYHITCPRCSVAREFVFRLPEMPLQVGQYAYGAQEHSQLIDAGQWWWLSVQYSSATPSDPAAQRTMLEHAVSAMEEIFKFIPPGQDAVPDSGFWTDHGRQVRASESPARFTRMRLQIYLDTYREHLQKLG